MKTISKSVWAIAIVTASVAVTICWFWWNGRPQPLPVSVVFQRYSTFSDASEPLAFLWLTNRSDERFVFHMVGNTNTLMLGTAFTGSQRSFMVNCEVMEQTPKGWTNWVQQRPPVGPWQGLSLEPHTGVAIRIPLQPDGSKRKVAALYEKPANLFVEKYIGSRFGMAILRLLPLPVLVKLSQQQPVFVRVWCDQELSYPGDEFGQR